jgi:DNA-binding response OmpR family regulator
MKRMRVLIVEDEPLMAEAIRDGLRLDAIAADIAGDGNTGFELLATDAYDIAVLDRVSALRKRLGEPWIIAAVPGVGYRIDTQPETAPEGGDRG